MNSFKLKSSFKPKGDQPQAIKSLTGYIKDGKRYQTLLGVTGSGKTFTLANVIAKLNKPTLVISHNKTLAAQLYTEFKEFFPENAVEYFVSYYDYYQPEAYIPQTDTYIEKDASINERLDMLRLSSTSSLMAREDVIIVASVSCIYNLGSPDEYKGQLIMLKRGDLINREDFLLSLVRIQYERNDYDFTRGKFRVRGNIIEVFPAYLEWAIRLEFEEDKLVNIIQIDHLTAKALGFFDRIAIYPAKHFLIEEAKRDSALCLIRKELEQRFRQLKDENKLLEAQRLKSRTEYDLEMLAEVGYCHGIENYSRYLSARSAGSRPFCLLDYFPEDFLTIIDESHVTVPQVRGMYNGDKARKKVLVDFGFRLESCLDNRPLRFDEFEAHLKQVVFVSATPGEFELQRSQDKVVEQIIRPTGLLDPKIIIRPTKNQIEDLVKELSLQNKNNQRSLVTTLTKRMAEDLASYLEDKKIKTQYLHSEIKTIERTKILKELRENKFDCLVGINLLREGLDLPEVSLVVILDADKEGFLRSATSLIQVSGRAARNINGRVIMYADKITGSMKKAIDESRRRREIQFEFNKKNKITPKTIVKAIKEGIEQFYQAKKIEKEVTGLDEASFEFDELIARLNLEMEQAARNLDFEQAIDIRDKIDGLKKLFNNKKKKNGRRNNKGL
ncbi:MAG: excinuclease ABC subunit UvrB [Candidatus Gygaella obscura]|nr:excinuclease ABC subunit UvrB [Candidatus Gygaella obscura]